MGGRTYGPTGVKLAEDRKLIELMNGHIRLVQERDCKMFLPGVVITTKSGAVYKGDYLFKSLE